MVEHLNGGISNEIIKRAMYTHVVHYIIDRSYSKQTKNMFFNIQNKSDNICDSTRTDIARTKNAS